MIIILCILAYIFIGVMCFKILEKNDIGFAEYWHNDGEFLHDDKDLIWASGAIGLSIFWIFTIPVLLFSKIIDKYIIIKEDK